MGQDKHGLQPTTEIWTWVAPLASASNPKATPVRDTTLGRWDLLTLVGSPARRRKTLMSNPGIAYNGVKETGTSCESVSPSWCSVVVAEEMYNFLEGEELLPEEQKGCRKKSRGTNDQLFIDKTVMEEVMQRKRNVAMAWVDYKKVYDMVPHSWIKECLNMFGIADNI